MSLIQQVNNNKRKEELKNTYYIKESSDFEGEFILQHSYTSNIIIPVFETKEAAEKYAKRHNLVIEYRTI